MKTLRPHQKKAVSNVVKGLKTASRGQLIMPCGSGKTLAGIHIRKRLKPKKTLILVPRLSLVKQLLDEYLAESNLGRTLVVCSDEETASDASKQYDITGVTNDPAVIRRQLNSNQEVTIFCTYPSSDKLASAYSLGRTKSIDLAIFDEAHRTCGGGLFSTAVRQSEVKIKKRLFMTATPRILDEVDGEETEVLSMDNEADYGKELHYLSFSDAIKQDILSDYRIAISAVSDSEVYEGIASGSVEESAKQIGFVKAIEKHRLRKVFAFHSSVAGMKRFQTGMESTVEVMRTEKKAKGTWWQRSLDGKQSFKWRQEQLTAFENLNGDSRAVIHNCQLFTEGVDCPDVDGIVFVNRKSSHIAIAQAVGRAIRPKQNGGIATIVVPVFVPDLARDEESIMNSSGFSVVFDVLRAMKSHDERIAGLCKAARKTVDQDGEDGDASLDELHDDELVLGDYESTRDYELPLDISGFSIPADKLRRSITSRIVKSFRIDWGPIDTHLGKKSDADIARAFGISQKSVLNRRNDFGIPAFGIDWSKIEPDFGKKSDVDIAKEIGVSATTVGRHRKALGVAIFTGINWDPIIPLMGTMTDKTLAENFGLHRQTVEFKRIELGIPSFTESNKINWDPIIPLMGSMTDKTLAGKFGLKASCIADKRKKLGIPSFTESNKVDLDSVFHLIGKATDTEVARRLGVCRSVIRNFRIENGIPAFTKRINWDPIIPLMGSMTDKTLAGKFGLSSSYICMKRKELKIPPFKNRQKQKKE